MHYLIYTLGCKVNTYESEVMDNILNTNGYIKNEEHPDVIIINTCTVTSVASNKSLKMVRHYVKEYQDAIVIVVGCMSQVETDKVLDIPGVSIILGNKNKTKIVDYINEFKKNNKQIVDVSDVMHTTFEDMQVKNIDKTRAVVKIEDGCNNFCSYCIIPYTRGNIRSKDKDKVISEIKELIKEGHHEIVLAGIHTGHYGADKNYRFYDLLKELVEIPGLERLRISSIELNEVNDDILDLMSKSNVIVNHIHIPLQAGSNHVLKMMNRHYDIDYFFERLDKIRSVRPEINITTDVIVGFPGETDADFKEGLDNIRKMKFGKVHVFPYSERFGTKSASMPDKIDDVTKKKRCHELLELSKELELDYMSHFLDKEVIFIPEVENDGYLVGHTGNYLLVKAQGCKELLHQDIKVKITDVKYPYVIGTID